MMANPGALYCDIDSIERDEAARRELARDRDFGSKSLGEGSRHSRFTYDKDNPIQACGTASGEIWHYAIVGTSAVLSIFGCVCCKEDGSSGHIWTNAHISAGQ
jgi:hypothetical protein